MATGKCQMPPPMSLVTRWAVLGFLWRSQSPRLMGLEWKDAGDAGHSACVKDRKAFKSDIKPNIIAQIKSDCKISSDHTLLTLRQNFWCYNDLTYVTYLGIPILIKVIYACDTSSITVGVVHMAHITSAFPRITRHHRLWTKQPKHSYLMRFNLFILICFIFIFFIIWANPKNISPPKKKKHVLLSILFINKFNAAKSLQNTTTMYNKITKIHVF